MEKRTLSVRAPGKAQEPQYEYDVGLLNGKFEPVTLAHLKHALAMSERCRLCVINLGSIDRARDPRFPFDFDDRRRMWYAALPRELHDRFVIVGQRDLGNASRWASAVDAKVVAAARDAGIDPDSGRFAIFGHHKDSTSAYLDDFPGYDLVELPAYQAPDPARMRGTMPYILDASDVREGMFETGLTNLEEAWLERALVAVSPGVADIIRDFIHGPEFPRLQEEYRRAKATAQQWKVREHKDGAGVPYPVIFNTADAVVVHGNMILMHQRDSYPGKDMWALPGVVMKPDERASDAAIRALVTKTAIDMTAGDLRRAIVDQWFVDDIQRSIRGRTITFPVLFQLGMSKASPGASRAKARALPRTKASERVAWFTPDDIEGMRAMIHEDHALIIDQAIERLRPRF